MWVNDERVRSEDSGLRVYWMSALHRIGAPFSSLMPDNFSHHNIEKSQNATNFIKKECMNHSQKKKIGFLS